MPRAGLDRSFRLTCAVAGNDDLLHGAKSPAFETPSPSSALNARTKPAYAPAALRDGLPCTRLVWSYCRTSPDGGTAVAPGVSQPARGMVPLARTVGT